MYVIKNKSKSSHTKLFFILGVKKMPKRKHQECPKNNQEAINWLSDFATCKQLRELINIKDRKITRVELLHIVRLQYAEININMNIVNRMYENHSTSIIQINKKRENKRMQKNAWRYLSGFIYTTSKIIAKISPCVFMIGKVLGVDQVKH